MTFDALVTFIFIALLLVSGTFLWIDNNTFIFTYADNRGKRYVRPKNKKRIRK